MARPIIALVTDFGARDHYVGSMKGAMLAVCPEAAIVDITHDVPPQDVGEGAAVLAAAYADFPPGTVFLAVVDPGVGSARRALAARADGYFFVGPDNGIFSDVFAVSPPELLVELTNREYARSRVSRTFEGRDRFAPAAAWLASGVPLERFGPVVTADAIERVARRAPDVSAAQLAGDVVRADRFGNLITNIDRPTFDAFAAGRRCSIGIGGRVVPLVATYTDVARGSVCALFGSTDRLEIAANAGSAEAALAVKAGARVIISPARD